MAAPLQLQSNRNQGIDIAESADIRKNDAQVQFSGSFIEPAALRVMHRTQVRLTLPVRAIPQPVRGRIEKIRFSSELNESKRAILIAS
jgi:hypothetical protein